MAHVRSKRVTQIVIEGDQVKFIVEDNVRDDETNELISHDGNKRHVVDASGPSIAEAVNTLKTFSKIYTA